MTISQSTDLKLNLDHGLDIDQFLSRIRAAVRTRIGLLFGITTLVSAFLIFQVQPILGKAILPWFGGGPSVWTTCLVFFQCALLAGYGYAYLVSRFFSVKDQFLAHLALIAGSLLFLPILPGGEWQPTESIDPSWKIVCLLILNVGVPYMLLAATSPLLQHWYANVQGKSVPYRLYALSNVGSLTALLSYPLVVEPNLSVESQSLFWSTGFILFSICCGLLIIALAPGSVSRQEKTAEKTQATPILKRTWFSWFLLSALGSMALVAITNEICQEMTVGPLLWIAPLSLYLVSFIIGFEKPQWYQPRWIGLITAFVLIAVFAIRCEAWTLLDDVFELAGIDVASLYSNVFFETGLYLGAMFLFCLICNGELYRQRPENGKLTSFYLALAFGGACGGVFVSLVCPNIFTSLFETEIVFVAALLLAVKVFCQDGCLRWSIPDSTVGFLAGTLFLICGYFFASQMISTEESSSLVQVRNFYGVVRVDREQSDEFGSGRSMYHGRTLHGFQYLSNESKSKPTSYYSIDSGVGIAVSEMGKKNSIDVGVVGLGTGTLATYGRQGDRFDFFEINPSVIALAENAFTYLRDSEAESSVLLGDARILIENVCSEKYDVLVLDAFSGDAIPTHLLTREAFHLFDDKIKQDGVIAVHVSNRYLNLVPVVARIAVNAKFKMAIVETETDEMIDSAGSSWILLTRNEHFTNSEALVDHQVDANDYTVPGVEWTDSFNSLVGLFK